MQPYRDPPSSRSLQYHCNPVPSQHSQSSDLRFIRTPHTIVNIYVPVGASWVELIGFSFGVKMSPSSKAVFGSNVGSDKGIPLSSCLPLLSFVPSLSSPSPSSLKYYNWIIFSVQGFHWAQNCYFEDPNKPLVIFTVLPIVLTRGLSATNLWWCSF